jgi:hypothetical protein
MVGPTGALDLGHSWSCTLADQMRVRLENHERGLCLAWFTWSLSCCRCLSRQKSRSAHKTVKKELTDDEYTGALDIVCRTFKNEHVGKAPAEGGRRRLWCWGKKTLGCNCDRELKLRHSWMRIQRDSPIRIPMSPSATLRLLFVYKPITCRVLSNLTIWFVRLRPLSTFNPADTTVSHMSQ